MLHGVTAVARHEQLQMSPEPFYAALFDQTVTRHKDLTQFTRFEQLLARSIKGALEQTSVDPADAATVLIISSTKGNIGLLENDLKEPELGQKISLPYSANKLMEHFGFVNKPVIVSNACISGILALLTAMRLIQSGKFTHAVVTGADVISQFILSGFQSFQATSPEHCKPFDAARNGINLGEGAGTVVLSSQKKTGSNIQLASGAVSNDANHISGPSRTGKELAQAIETSLKHAGLRASDIEFVSAHGTATIYNDEMESLAFSASGLEGVPVNSLKGYYGHTLGAAGLIETIIGARSMQAEVLIPTKGFTNLGVSVPIQICSELKEGPIRHLLKTASGFGGCNAALVLSKS